MHDAARFQNDLLNKASNAIFLIICDGKLN